MRKFFFSQIDVKLRLTVKMSGIFVRLTKIHASIREKKKRLMLQNCVSKSINNSEGRVWHHLERSYCYEKQKLNMLMLH